MDITYDWVTDPAIGPVIAEEAEKAAAQARIEAKREAQAEALAAEQRILRRLAEKRFGAISAAVTARINSMSMQEIEEFSLRLLDAGSLDELFA